MMKNKRNTIVAAVMLLISPALMAQDTLRTDVIDVVKNYNATLNDAIKIKVLPNPEIPEFKAPNLKYTLPAAQLALTPTFTVAKPLFMGSSALPKLKNNYTKIGFGNYASPIFEFYMNSLRSRSYHANIFYKHYSAKGDKDFNRFSDNNLGGDFKRFYKKSTLSLTGNYQRNAFRAFGLPDSITDPGSFLQIDPAKRILNTINLEGRVNNKQQDSSSFRYDLGLNYYLFQATKYAIDTKEHDIIFDGAFTKLIAGVHLVELYTALNVVSAETPYNRTYFHFNPDYHLSPYKGLHLKVGFNSTYFKDDQSNSNFNFFPVADARYEVIPQKAIAFAGIDGGVIKNTNRTVLNENRFAFPNGQFNNSIKKFEFYAGIKGNFSAKTGYLFSYGYRQMKDMIFFVNDYAYSRGADFTAMNDNARVTTIKGELNFQYSERMRLAAVAHVYAYKMDSLDKASQLPTTDLRLNATYNIGDKFLLKADVFFMNPRYSYVIDPISNPAGSYTKMKSLLDMNLGIDYRYNKTVSLFLNFNNLTANRYQRWYNYPVYGFNLHGGLNITF